MRIKCDGCQPHLVTPAQRGCEWHGLSSTPWAASLQAVNGIVIALLGQSLSRSYLKTTHCVESPINASSTQTPTVSHERAGHSTYTQSFMSS